MPLHLIQRLQKAVWRRTTKDQAAAAASVAVAPALPAAAIAHGHVGAQAYVLVHGMGEQIPMDTIKGFARTVWSLDGAVHVPGMPNADQMWSRPDDRTGSLELRRLTTRKSATSTNFPAGVRTDFYELYWADLTAGSTWEQFSSWVRYLLFRPLSKVPRDVRPAWMVLWFASAAVLALGLVGLIPEDSWKSHVWWWLPQKAVIAAAAALLAVVHRFASATFGRVVRYTRSDPDNVAARKAVRERGLILLRELHRDHDYQRVVIVGHSLGSILAHDLISYFWAEQAAARTFDEDTAEIGALAEVERAAAAVEVAPSQAALNSYRSAQAALCTLLRTRSAQANDTKARWLISDFVTLGSPLTHAEFLLADGDVDLKSRRLARELPTCPPVREQLDPKVLSAAKGAGLLAPGSPASSALMTFPDTVGSGRRTLHHAAPFAAVRWTNVYDPSRLVAQGDMISGPLRENFGNGIVDVNLSDGDLRSRRFTHTRYWDETQSQVRLAAVRKAINILDLG